MAVSVVGVVVVSVADVKRASWVLGAIGVSVADMLCSCVRVL